MCVMFQLIRNAYLRVAAAILLLIVPELVLGNQKCAAENVIGIKSGLFIHCLLPLLTKYNLIMNCVDSFFRKWPRKQIQSASSHLTGDTANIHLAHFAGSSNFHSFLEIFSLFGHITSTVICSRETILNLDKCTYFSRYFLNK